MSPETKPCFSPGQLVLFEFAWDAETKYRLFPIEDEKLGLGMFIRMIEYSTKHHNHALILFEEKLVCAYPRHIRLYEPEL